MSDRVRHFHFKLRQVITLGSSVRPFFVFFFFSQLPPGKDGQGSSKTSHNPRATHPKSPRKIKAIDPPKKKTSKKVMFKHHQNRNTKPFSAPNAKF